MPSLAFLRSLFHMRDVAVVSLLIRSLLLPREEKNRPAGF